MHLGALTAENLSMQMSATAVAEFDQVSKAYPDGLLGRSVLAAVTEVSFQILPGEVFGLVGPNRAGKTTLVKMLLSLCRPTSGRVLRLGKPARDRGTLARIGFVHENQALPRYWHAAGLLEYYGALALMPQPEVRKRIPSLLEEVGLADRSREPISRFSKGMMQRLGLAQAVLNDPDLLVLDEPTEGLDLDGRRLVLDMVARQRRRGGTVLLVSHALAEVEQVCDRLGVLFQGRLIFAGRLPELLQDPKTKTARPLGTALQRLYEASTS
jgi:ABC-2 type transport system ATP-binding protein